MFGHVPLFKTIGMSHIRRSSIFFPTPMKLKIREAPVYKRKITYPTNFSLEKKQPPCKFHTPFSHAISVCLLKKKWLRFFCCPFKGQPQRPPTDPKLSRPKRSPQTPLRCQSWAIWACEVWRRDPELWDLQIGPGVTRWGPLVYDRYDYRGTPPGNPPCLGSN